MKVLVIGSGAREHAIAHALMRGDSVSEVTVAPGNPGMELDGIRTTQLNPSNHAALIDFVKNNGYDWVFVGPEVPLIEGIVDDFAAAGIKAFGPNKAAAQIEGSKDFAKQLMERHDIPTAKYQTFDDLERSTAYVREHGAPIVIKADGLAAGKGVTVAMDEETAIAALEDIFVDHRFGNAGAKVVIEDFLEGQEFSLMSFVNGTDFWPMPISQDHKRAYDGDKGPNTGGMGAYSPVPQIGQDVIDTAISPMSGGTSQPATETLAYALRSLGYQVDLDDKALIKMADFFKGVRADFLKDGTLDPISMSTDTQCLNYQIPGGMLSNLLSQLKQVNALDRFDEVLVETPKVRKDMGYPPLVTPTSQMVGVQAVRNVLDGQRYKSVSKEIKAYCRGEYGHTPAPIDPEIQKMILGDEQPLTVRYADTLEPVVDKTREKLGDLARSDEDVLSYIAFPNLAEKFFEERKAKEENVATYSIVEC